MARRGGFRIPKAKLPRNPLAPKALGRKVGKLLDPGKALKAKARKATAGPKWLRWLTGG